MSKVLKKDISVVLSGEGADELFGGYGRVQRSPMDWKKIAFVRQILSPSFANMMGTKAKKHSLISLLNIDSHMMHFFMFTTGCHFKKNGVYLPKKLLKFWRTIK